MPSDKTQTVAITGANGLVGRALLERLRHSSLRPIALIRQPTELPVNEAVSGPLNSPLAQEAVRKADYLVHLAGALFPLKGNSYKAANLDTTEAIAKPLKEGKPKRVLFLSYVGADENSKNLYLQTKGIAERLLGETGKEVVIFRSTHIIGSPESPGPLALSMLARAGKKVGILGNGSQQVAPLYVGDAVSALVNAMERGRPGIYDLTGPDQMSMDDLARLLNRNPLLKISHLPNWGARLAGSFLPMLPGPFVDVILQDSLGDPSRAIAAFGLKLTSLHMIWK
jgi:nucleoside-diphosphate-sugar epimerase